MRSMLLLRAAAGGGGGVGRVLAGTQLAQDAFQGGDDAGERRPRHVVGGPAFVQ